MNEYTITRLDEWSDEQWAEICDAVADTVVSVADTFGEE